MLCLIHVLRLLGFYQLASAAAPRLGTVKTDDDCFLNLDAILPTMERLPKQGWWSQFREGWPVAHYGKWAEHDYTVSLGLSAELPSLCVLIGGP